MSFSKRYAKQQEQYGEQKAQKQAQRLSVADRTEKKNTAVRYWRTIIFSLLWMLIFLVLTFVWRYRDQVLFPIKHIDVQGTLDSTKLDSLQPIFSQYASGSMILLPKQQLKNKLLQVSWIDQVSIKPIWPATLQILIEQKYPIARFGSNDLLSSRGNLFALSDMKATENLPEIVGPENRANQLWQAYLTLNKILLPLDLHINRFEVSPRLAYSLVLNNGLTIYLGSMDIESRLMLFTHIYAKSIQPRLGQIDYVDMRYNSAMAVGLKSVEAHNLDKDTQKNT